MFVASFEGFLDVLGQAVMLYMLLAVCLGLAVADG